jgi:hypothetical protein
MSHFVIDTNVPKAASGSTVTPQASPECVLACIQRLKEIKENHIVVIDNQWHILNEYKRQLEPLGQATVGYMFLKWVLNHLSNPQHCEQISITPRTTGESVSYVEFPINSELATFHHKDHKFVAVALAHANRPPPPILNAVDSDWWDFRHALSRLGIIIEFLCPEAMK